MFNDVGFPRDSNNVSYCRYLFARKLFRTEVKRAKNQATAEYYVNFERLKNSNPRFSWKQIKLSNQTSTKLYTINGKSKINEITSDFQDHFNRLLNTPRIPNYDNEKSNSELYSLFDKLGENVNNSSDFYVSELDVSKAIKKLNQNKAKDPFQIQAEHLIFAPENEFLTYLTRLLNDLFNDENLPDLLSTSIIIPLAKSTRKSLKDPNNYRGISLIPILTKLMEQIILIKHPELTEHGPSQFGFTSRSSTTHAETVIYDTIRHYNNQGSPVYICSLDAEKAFDCCNWLKLFQKLNSESILPKTVIRTLIQLYMNGDATVRYQNHKSAPFKLSQGVRQGSILSPHLYNFYTKDILENIKSLNAGTYLPNMDTSIIAFADDIILLSPTLRGLQMMINKCVQKGCEHLIKFNDKTQFVISGRSPIPNPTITVNNVSIHPKRTLTHLGFEWINSITSNELTLKQHLTNRINKLWATTASLVSSGIRKLHPYSIATIYKTVIIPQLLYGLEIVDINQTATLQLNRCGRSSLKSLLGLSKYSKNYLLDLFHISEISTLILQRRGTTF